MSVHYTKSALLKNIHCNERSLVRSHMFQTKTSICLLDFLGAGDYFITEYGAIWPRQKTFPNKAGYLNRGWLPMVIRDRRFPYHWVHLPTVNGPIWYPVNQLLGWAFKPVAKIDKFYFLTDFAGLYPYSVEWFSWTTKTPKRTGPSLYLDFMDSLYEKAEEQKETN